MRVLITGATGFIGNTLVRMIRQRGCDVTCLVRKKDIIPLEKRVSCVYGDLRDRRSLIQAIKASGPIDVIFHLAALLPSTQPAPSLIEYIISNELATCELLDTAHKLGIRTFIYASSLPIVGTPSLLPVREDHPLHPNHPYLLSKLNGEQACQFYNENTNIRVVSLRITSPYGYGMSASTVLPLFVNLAAKGDNIHLHGSGSRTQNFVHVNDVAQACYLAAKANKGGVFNIGGPASCSMHMLAKSILRLSPDSSGKILFSNQPDPQENHRWDIDLHKAERILAYTPNIPLEEGIKAYIAQSNRQEPIQRWWRNS